MNPHLWWYVARAAGFTSWLFAATSVATGLLLSSKASMRPRPNWQLDLHRHQAALALALLALHIAALVADSYSHFTASSILIPFASTWKPLAVASGIIAMYLLITVQVTSLLRKHMPAKVWKTIHLSSLLAYLLSTAHFLQAGTDHRRAPVLIVIIAITATNLGLLSFRILASPRERVGNRGQTRTAGAQRDRTVVASAPSRSRAMLVVDAAACHDGSL